MARDREMHQFRSRAEILCQGTEGGTGKNRGINMQKIPTDELDALLENVDPGHLDDYLEASKKFMINAPREFSYYVKDLLS